MPCKGGHGALGEIRTPDPRIRSQRVKSRSGFSHFGDAQDFLKSGGKGEAAKDGWPPGGLRIFSVLERSTGYQGFVSIRKMGKPGAGRLVRRRRGLGSQGSGLGRCPVLEEVRKTFAKRRETGKGECKSLTMKE